MHVYHNTYVLICYVIHWVKLNSTKQRDPTSNTLTFGNCFDVRNENGEKLDPNFCYPVASHPTDSIDGSPNDTVVATETELECQWITALNYDQIFIEDSIEEEGDEDWEPEDAAEDDSDEDLVDGDLNLEGLGDEGEVISLLKNEDKILTILNDYQTEDLVFTDGELEELKTKEKILMERNNRGYYRCRNKHSTVYNKIMETLDPYLSKENLRQLFHPYHTQHNEALNKSVASYAPKHKTFSTTQSLSTRVGIAAGVQILGYHEFWRRVFQNFNIHFDDHLSNVLTKMQQKKSRQQVRSKSIEKKKRRSALRYRKVAEAHMQDMEDQRTNSQYCSGVAVDPEVAKVVKEVMSAQSRNPVGIADNLKRCKYYHHRFCTVLGHTSASHKNCFMKGKSKKQRDEAEMEIRKELYATHSKEKQGTCTVLVIQLNYDFKNT